MEDRIRQYEHANVINGNKPELMLRPRKQHVLQFYNLFYFYLLLLLQIPSTHTLSPGLQPLHQRGQNESLLISDGLASRCLTHKSNMTLPHTHICVTGASGNMLFDLGICTTCHRLILISINLFLKKGIHPLKNIHTYAASVRSV